MSTKRPSDAADVLSSTRTLLYVIGAQKAGTTWFHQQFARHPKVHFARKEFHYWSARRSPYVNFVAVPVQPMLGLLAKLRGRLGDVLIRVHPRIGDSVLAWRMILSAPEDHSDYRQALVRGIRRGAEVVGDITPNYALLSPRAFSEMAALHPDVRFIFILRDPVDRLWSGIRQRCRRWFGRPGVDPALAARWFELALDDPFDVDLRKSCYEDTIVALDKVVAPDHVLYLFYEDLFTDAALDRIYAFLGLDPHPVDFGENTVKTAEWKDKPDAEVMDRAASVLAPTYDFVHSRFGAAVPAKWRRPGRSAP